MPVVNISAVTTGTDTLTATAHGLNTGDRFRVRNIGGALPTGLAAVTTYFAIRVDANNVKPASSSALAIAGTAVDITGAGSGTNQIEYGLPYAERRVATDMTQIFPIDDNEAWDALKALHAVFTGQAQSIWTELTLALPENQTAVISPPTLAAGNTDDYNPTGLNTCQIMRITPDAGGTSTIRSIVVGNSGRLLTIHNIGAANLSFAHNVGGSAFNQFLLPAAATLVIGAGGCATFWYDTASTRWRLRSKGV